MKTMLILILAAASLGGCVEHHHHYGSSPQADMFSSRLHAGNDAAAIPPPAADAGSYVGPAGWVSPHDTDTGSVVPSGGGASYAATRSYRVGGGYGTKTCYVGPRGGTYTITSGGNKNYSGC